MLLLEGGEETLDLPERWDHKDCKVEWDISNLLSSYIFPFKGLPGAAGQDGIKGEPGTPGLRNYL